MDTINIYNFNKYQTQLTDELLNELHPEVREKLFEYINTVPFIANLTSKDRPYAKDLPRDDSGKIIIDLCNPHILENMDYFREMAIHFEEHGCYTKLRPNANPNSEFGQLIKREITRILNGMVRPEDGEWVTGEFYFYLNYSRMSLTKTKKGQKRADRVESFPEVWDGVYLLSHYLHQARFGGLYDGFEGGKQAAEIAKRGASKSYFMSSTLARIFTVGDTVDARSKVTGVITAYEKEYLTKDGTLNKFISTIDFLADNCPFFPSARIKDSLQEMDWIIGYKDADTGVSKGLRNEILGFSSKDNPDKGRGKRAAEIIFEEFGNFPKFLDTWNTALPSVKEGEFSFGQLRCIGCVCEGTKVWNKFGEYINIEDINQEDGIIGFKDYKANIEPITYIQEEAYKECVEIKFKSGNSLKCSIDHPILTRKKHSRRTVDYKIGNSRDFWYEYEFIPASDLKVTKNQNAVVAIEKVNIFGEETLFDARLVGMLIGDGSYGFDKTPVFSNCDVELLNYVKEKYSWKKETGHITKDGREYEEIRIRELCSKLREIGIYGQTKTAKRLPTNYMRLSEKDSALLLAGLFDTDGCVYFSSKHHPVISITQSSVELLTQIQILLLKFGIKGYIKKYNPRISGYRKDKNAWYTLNIYEINSLYNFINSIPLLVSYKKDNLNKIKNYYDNKKRVKVYPELPGTTLEYIESITNIGVQRIYNLTANDSHTYIANGIITHNTGGTEGSDFSGAQELIYHPDGYDVYGLKNVFDSNMPQGSKSCFFFGAYLSTKGYYNEDGVSDVIGALIFILKERIKVKYNSSDPNTLSKKISELPITIKEAILKRDGTIYPVNDLSEQLTKLDADPTSLSRLYVGDLSLTGVDVKFNPTSDVTPIMDFPHKTNKHEGAIIIHELPIKGVDGKPQRGRYISGADVYDDDSSESLSLGALYIMDLWTDKLVLEYVGRPTFADDFYENCRRCLLFYNAECNYENNKKGLFKYFSQHNALFLLSPTLDFLKEKQMMKESSYGNKAYGTLSTTPIKNYGRRCIRDWLLKPVKTTVVKTDENGVLREEEITVRNLTFIPFRALLQELIGWNMDGNFDRHDALLMLMLLREDKLRLFGDNVHKQRAATNNAEDLSNDSFFEKNYKSR